MNSVNQHNSGEPEALEGLGKQPGLVYRTVGAGDGYKRHGQEEGRGFQDLLRGGPRTEVQIPWEVPPASKGKAERGRAGGTEGAPLQASRMSKVLIPRALLEFITSY